MPEQFDGRACFHKHFRRLVISQLKYLITNVWIGGKGYLQAWFAGNWRPLGRFWVHRREVFLRRLIFHPFCLFRVRPRCLYDARKHQFDRSAQRHCYQANLGHEGGNGASRGGPTVSVCFSKGLGAPVGSALAGPKSFIQGVRRFRKMFGGGMRQAGIIAAGALFALRNHRARLAEDHANAKALAFGLAGVEGLETNPAEVETNMVRIRVRPIPAQELVERLKAQGVLVLALGPDTIRAVTNLMVSAEDIQEAAAIISKVLQRAV
ncbi:MAG: beta-eliminating lyase-related protein [Verrucomicrobiota bacterium]